MSRVWYGRRPETDNDDRPTRAEAEAEPPTTPVDPVASRALIRLVASLQAGALAAATAIGRGIWEDTEDDE